MLRIVCSVWAVTPPSTTTPSRIPPWPDTMMKSPARTNGEYGPNGLFIEPTLGESHDLPRFGRGCYGAEIPGRTSTLG